MLLLHNVEVVELVVLVISAVLGVVALAGSFEGGFYRDLKNYERVVFGVIALLSIHHDFWISIAAIVGIALMIVYFKKSSHDGQLPEKFEEVSA